MARRRGKPGNYLYTDNYTGMTIYATQAKLDLWGARAKKPLLRNLQEISFPLEDPQPVPYTIGSSYETSIPCDYEVAPQYVGLTNVPTNPYNAAFQALNLNPGIGSMTIGCTFKVF